jgi:hypothetical protein
MFDFKRAERAQMIAGGLSFAVYAPVAWAGAQIFDLKFWKVFGSLLVARAFFSLIEGAAIFSELATRRSPGSGARLSHSVARQ